MSSEEFAISILAARERRSGVIEEYVGHGHRAALFLSLNIPGGEKSPPGTGPLFSWSMALISGEFPEAEKLVTGDDPLGPFALFSINREPFEVKLRCIRLENLSPAARLIDLDVFDGNCRQVGRSLMGMEPRPCLLCPLPAVECIRLRRHHYREVKGKTDELLAPFRD
jgi:holo-ACP synthase CitX